MTECGIRPRKSLVSYSDKMTFRSHNNSIWVDFETLRLLVGCIVIITIIGCGGLNHGLEIEIQKESNNLIPNVADLELSEKVALQVINGERLEPLISPKEQPKSLDDFVLLALKRSPVIRSRVRELEALGFRVTQIGSLEDPMFSFMPPTGDMTETAAGMIEGAVGVSQKIPFPGKIEQRVKLAEQSVRSALAELADARIEIASQVAHAYFDYYLAHVSNEITHESKNLLEQIHSVVSARYQAGSVPQQDILRTEVELLSLQNKITEFEQQRKSAQVRLNSLMNRTFNDPIETPEALEMKKISWTMERLGEIGLKNNPKLVGAKARIQRELESIKLAKLEYYPDLRLGFSYNFIGSGISPVSSGDDNWSLPTGINLPIWWQRIRAQILMANANMLNAVELHEQIRNVVESGLRDTLIKIESQYHQAELYRDSIIPRALQTVEISTANYQSGEVEFSALVENWRTFFSSSLAYQRTLVALEQSFVDLSQLAGVRLARVDEVASK